MVPDDPADRPAPEIILDITRLMSRAFAPAPTGVDRVEMAYAEGLLRRAGDRLEFGTVYPPGVYGRASKAAAVDFLERTARRWDLGAPGDRQAARREGLTAWGALAPRRPPRSPHAGGRVYIVASHMHLDRPDLLRRILKQEEASLLTVIHDLIPMQFPEYARPGGAERHLTRIRTAARLSSGVITVSESTREAFLPFVREAGRDIPVKAAPLAVNHDGVVGGPWEDGRFPYFVCLGTLEPRKNHLLLLNLWRSMVTRRGAENTPKLLLIGRRGWENQNILAMLDRCPSLKGVVHERGGLSDRSARGALGGARALLMPSFAEGFGLPVTEAIVLGAPVICSDLPALREAGGHVPDYLDPLDGAAWLSAIDDYAQPASPRRQAQTARAAGYAAPSWDDHLSRVLSLLPALVERQPAR
jgi:glycosyltransferase involved in cell wall biosynthesis